MPDHEFIGRSSLWFPCAIHIALLFVIAPVVYWFGLALLLGGWHLDFGSVLALLIGIPMTYPFFGISLLLASAVATLSTVRISRFRSRWQRATVGALAGMVIGALLGGYVAMKLARDGGASPADADHKVLFTAGLITGAILGPALSGLWRLSCWWAGAVSRGVAGRDASP